MLGKWVRKFPARQKLVLERSYFLGGGGELRSRMVRGCPSDEPQIDARTSARHRKKGVMKSARSPMGHLPQSNGLLQAGRIGAATALGKRSVNMGGSRRGGGEVEEEEEEGGGRREEGGGRRSREEEGGGGVGGRILAV